MDKLLRVLHLEDDPDFPPLVAAMLTREGVLTEVERVADLPSLGAALQAKSFDIILADYSLPTCDGIQAMRMVREGWPDIPFLLVSGTIGEQAAIESLRCGATDYVLKNALERLVPAVRRAVIEARERAQRRHYETELIRRERYFRALTENSLDALAILDGRGVFQYNSPSLRTVLGYEPVAFLGRQVFDFVHPDDLQGVRGAFEEVLQNSHRSVRHEFRFKNTDDSWRHVEVVWQNRLEDPEIGGVVVNSRDITDRKLLEEQLRQSQKMEAIGQLAGGVAHDFNNILTVIHGYAALLLDEEILSGFASKSVRQIVTAAERAADLTRQLLTFSRRQVMQPRTLDLNQVVRDMTLMLGRLLGEDILLQLEYWPQPSLVVADVSMVQQVLLNLAVNARDAMPGGGRLSIRIAMEDVTDAHVVAHPEGRPGPFVCLRVEDNGCGIASENLRRVFEPFFTTKEVGKGTGLGLATVYGIAEQHQGWIEVESELGRGASFRFYLPASTAPLVAETAEESAATQPVRGGNETILVVEDEAPVRELVCSVLKNHGYDIIPAESGPKALDLSRQAGLRVDLLLTDLVMPDRLNGRELAEQLQSEQPSMRVIFTSGYSADVVGKDFVVQQGLHYLQKPYDPQKLALTVRECLDAPRSGASGLGAAKSE